MPRAVISKAVPASPELLPGDPGAVAHALNRLAYGPRPGDVERVRSLGLAVWLENQLSPASIEDPGLAERLSAVPTVGMTQIELMTRYPPPPLLRALGRRLERQGAMDGESVEQMLPELARKPGKGLAGPGRVVAELGQAKLIRAVHSERQLQELMVDFWFNHFNVFIGKGADRWLTTSYERDAIRPHAMGRFRDLLGAVASHPAMLFYLDNWISAAPGVSFDRRDMQSLATRAIREQGLPPGGLATLILRDRGMDTRSLEQRIERAEHYRGRGRAGRYPLQDPDEPGRRGLNENYARELLELHTLGVDGGYTQRDVVEVARCFTGWTLLPLQAGQGFVYVDRLHDRGKKTVLGRKITGQGRKEGEAVLDLLASHPSTARFVSTKLARRFFGDDPPSELVDRMAETFIESKGEITAVLRTLFYSAVFWDEGSHGSKVKTPFEFVASAIRATGSELTGSFGGPQDPRPGALFSLRRMGQPPYGAQPPTGYADTAESWVSSGALLDRMKFALGLAGDRIPGLQYRPSELFPSSLPLEQSLSRTGLELLGRAPSAATVAALSETFENPTAVSELGRSPAILGSAEGRTRFGVGLLLASPDFQRR